MWEKRVQQQMRMARSTGAPWKSGRTVCLQSSGVSRIHVEQELSATTVPLSKSVRSRHGVHCHQIQSQPSQRWTPSPASYDSYWYTCRSYALHKYKHLYWPHTCMVVFDSNPKQLIHDLPFTIVPIYWPHRIVTITDSKSSISAIHWPKIDRSTDN